jgi:hypothetical protein
MYLVFSLSDEKEGLDYGFGMEIAKLAFMVKFNQIITNKQIFLWFSIIRCCESIRMPIFFMLIKKTNDLKGYGGVLQ